MSLPSRSSSIPTSFRNNAPDRRGGGGGGGRGRGAEPLPSAALPSSPGAPPIPRARPPARAFSTRIVTSLARAPPRGPPREQAPAGLPPPPGPRLPPLCPLPAAERGSEAAGGMAGRGAGARGARGRAGAGGSGGGGVARGRGAGAGGGPAGPPRTQEEAYSQARAALGSAFEAKKRRGGKKSTRAGKGPRVRVEIPLPPEVSEKAADEVVALLDEGSFVGRGTPLDVRFASPELAALAECPTLSSAAPPPAGAVLVAIGPTAADLTALNALVQRFDWAGAIVVNPEGWEARSVDQSLIPFTRTFEIAYSFLPLSIQGLLGSTSNGAVFRSVEGAKTPAAVPWRIYLMDEDPPKQIAETTKRPGDAEIETTLYNSMAQESPINQGIRAVRTAGEGLMNLLPGREGK